MVQSRAMALALVAEYQNLNSALRQRRVLMRSKRILTWKAPDKRPKLFVFLSTREAIQ